MRFCVALCLLFTLCGCSFFRYRSAEVSGEKMARLEGVQRSGHVTIVLDGATISDAVRALPYGVNIVYDSELAKKPVNLDVVDLPYMDYIYALSKVLGCSVSRHGLVWVFSYAPSVKDQGGGMFANKGSSVASPESLAPSSSVGGSYMMWFDLMGWSESDMGFLGMGGVKWVAGDTWLYKGSLEGALDLAECIEVMRRNTHVDYYFEIYFLSSDFSFDFGSSDALGLTWDWRHTLSKGMNEIEWGMVSKVALSSMAEVSKSKSAKVVSGVVREGVEYSCKIGDSMPYVSRVVQESGTVSDTGVRYESVGLGITFKVKGASVGLVDLQIDNNDVSGFQQGYAVKHGSNLKTSYSVTGSDMRYVGSIWSDAQQRGLLSLSSKLQSWDVFVRVERLDLGQYMKKNHRFFEKNSENQIKNLNIRK